MSDDDDDDTGSQPVMAAISAMSCPKCAQPLTRRVDPRQAGTGPQPGQVWINYRCAGRCGFAADRPETP